MIIGSAAWGCSAASSITATAAISKTQRVDLNLMLGLLGHHAVKRLSSIFLN
jgi:hypothetical protein